MINFKNKFLGLPIFIALTLAPTLSSAQQKVYGVPPVQLMSLQKAQANDYGLEIANEKDIINGQIWDKTAYLVIASKFAKVPSELSPKAQELLLKLIKTTATPPQGTTGDTFITLKLNMLFQRGRFEDVYRLIQKIPEKERSKSINKIYAELLLLQNTKAACQLQNKSKESAFWIKLSTACDTFALNKDKAEKGLDLLKTENIKDTFFTKSITALLEKEPITTQPKEITPLNVALWRKAGNSLEDLYKPTSPIWFKRTFATDKQTPLINRLQTAEELVQIGVLSPLVLRMLYQQVEFDENFDELAQLSSLTEVEKRAYYVQKSASYSSLPDDNLKKHFYLNLGLHNAKNSNVLFAFANGAKDVLQTMRPDIETISHSSIFVEAFALAGLEEQALDWFKKAEILFPKSETVAYAWPFAELLQASEEKILLMPQISNTIAYAQNVESVDDTFIAKADRLMLLFKTLDMFSSEESWNYTSFAENSAESFIVSRERRAKPLNAKAVGPEVLDALVYVSGDYVDTLNALTKLSDIGLKKDARHIALQVLSSTFNIKLDDE